MAISRAKKNEQLTTLIDLLSKAKSVILADYTRLSVNQGSNLRKKLSEAKATMIVAKNSLIEKALKETKVDETAILKGQTAVIVSEDAALTPFTILINFIKEAGTPAVVSGFFEGRKITGDEVKALAAIPSREVLLGRLIGSFKAPMSKFAVVISELSKKGGVN